MKIIPSVFIVLVVVSASIAQAQQAGSAQAATTYSWHGELVSLDQAAKTVTVKTMVVGDTAAGELKGFKAGERVLLHWSGFDNSASGVRGFMKYDAAHAGKEPFLLPAEVVSPTVENAYVTFKLPVNDAAINGLTSIKPGEWMTITSKHRPASDADAIAAVRPYVTSDQKS